MIYHLLPLFIVITLSMNVLAYEELSNNDHVNQYFTCVQYKRYFRNKYFHYFVL